MNNKYFLYQPIILHNSYTQTSLICAMIFREELPSRLPDPIQQIQNLPRLDIRYPIENSDSFCVNVTDGDNIKKCTLQDLARLVPKDLLEGILEPKIKDGKLIIIDKEISDSQYFNKILVSTGSESYIVIPNQLITEARKEEQIKKINNAKIQEQITLLKPALWGGNVNGISTENANHEKILIFTPHELTTVMFEITDDSGVGSTIRRPIPPTITNSQPHLSIQRAPETIKVANSDHHQI
jgi:hypothetical protein